MNYFIYVVLDFGVAKTNLIDKFDHKIPKGDKYITCNYFEKCQEQKGHIKYKLMSDEVYIPPYQVAVPFVSMENNCLSITEYQFISDCV